jgi:hypothetical protein
MQFKTFFVAAALMMGFASARLLGEVRTSINDGIGSNTDSHSLPPSKSTLRKTLWSGPVKLFIVWNQWNETLEGLSGESNDLMGRFWLGGCKKCNLSLLYAQLDAVNEKSRAHVNFWA